MKHWFQIHGNSDGQTERNRRTHQTHSVHRCQVCCVLPRKHTYVGKRKSVKLRRIENMAYSNQAYRELTSLLSSDVRVCSLL